MPQPGARVDPLPAFQFTVEIDGIAVASFSEVSGLESETAVLEYRNGNDQMTRKLPGLHRFGDIVLKRGVTPGRELWNWRKAVIDGNVQRRNGSIVLLDGKREEVVRWNFSEGWPRKWVGPTLDARAKEVAIETLEIAVERIELAS